jgi:opacity protein-like surface antigen
MKKVIYFVISLLVLGDKFNIPVIACDLQTSTNSLFDQGRIVLGLATEYLSIEAELKDNFSPFAMNYQSTRSQTRKHAQVAPSLELGTTVLDDFYLGFFASWRYAGTKTKSRAPFKNLTHFYHEFKINHYADIFVKPGYKLTSNTLVYGLLGPSIVRWSHTTDQYITNWFGQERLQDRFKISKTNVGLGLGLGLECLFKRKYSFSIEYGHYFQKSTSKKQNMTFIDNIGGPVVRSGAVSKRVLPSYSTIAVRFTLSLQLW